ncbi:MAG: GTPase HflX [Defluviitaleaceae bacterium]|nr:GTPase HflX [Defluviitaleaceae bacterium]
MNKVQGNTGGIRQTFIQRLESIYDMEVDRKQFCTIEILESLAFFTGATGREAMVYIDRSGRILTVTVGEQDRVSLPTLRKRRSESRLSGIRCIHTHPGRMGEPPAAQATGQRCTSEQPAQATGPGCTSEQPTKQAPDPESPSKPSPERPAGIAGNPRLSSVDIQSLKSLRLDAMAAVGVLEGMPVAMQVGILDAVSDDDNLSVNLYGPFSVNAIPDNMLWEAITQADIHIRPTASKKAEAEIARTILVGIDGRKDDPGALDELLQLANTAGFITVGKMLQPRDKPNSSYYIGHGKLQELILEIQKLQADAVIFDDELTPAQLRNIQKELGKKIEIIDRTALILDIFSSRAQTHEGRLQVELAQTKYLLPRMTGYWTHMGRMGGGGRGGGGARRGEGETQLEVDRRLLRDRVTELEKEIDKIKSRRNVQRIGRERSKIPVVALVGYTNAGKSTLMNHLSGSNVLAEDKLFATLDPISRRINYGSGEFLLIDTVGFIKKLPHDLVNAFRATLEETRHADLLLHVVDASSEERAQQIEVVNEVLSQLEASSKPVLMVYNKCDIATEITPAKWAGSQAANPGAPHKHHLDTTHLALGSESIAISAKTGIGIDSLKAAITHKFSAMRTEVSVILPLDSGALISRIYESGQVLNCQYQADGIHISAIVPQEDESRLRALAIKVLQE